MLSLFRKKAPAPVPVLWMVVDTRTGIPFRFSNDPQRFTLAEARRAYEEDLENGLFGEKTPFAAFVVMPVCRVNWDATATQFNNF